MEIPNQVSATSDNDDSERPLMTFDSFQAFFAICLVIQMLPLPESPRWLVEKGRSSEAGEILAALRNASADDEDVVYLRRQIESSIEIESAGGPFQYSELFKGGKLQNLRRLIICGMVNMMQQYVQSAVNLYMTEAYLTLAQIYRVEHDQLLRPNRLPKSDGSYP